MPGPDERRRITLSQWAHWMFICQWDKTSNVGQRKYDRGKQLKTAIALGYILFFFPKTKRQEKMFSQWAHLMFICQWDKNPMQVRANLTEGNSLKQPSLWVTFWFFPKTKTQEQIFSSLRFLPPSQLNFTTTKMLTTIMKLYWRDLDIFHRMI